MPKVGPSNKKDSEITVVETHNLTSDQISLVKYLRSQPTLAAKVLLGVNLEWYQSEALEDVWRKRFSIFCWSRQIGKTFLEAVLFALLSVLYPDEDAVFIAPSMRQALNPFNYVRNFYSSHEVFRSMVRGKLTKMKVEFKNNSIITPLPQGDGCVSRCLMEHGSGFAYIEDLFAVAKNGREVREKEPVPLQMWFHGNDGLQAAEYIFYNGKVETRTLRTKRGYELVGSMIHPVLAVRGERLEWVRYGDIRVGDKVAIDRTVGWPKGTNDVLPGQAYAIGAMIGDGNYTNQYRLGFANDPSDAEIVSHLNDGMEKIVGARFVQTADQSHWVLYGKEKRSEFLRFMGLPDLGHRAEQAYAKNKRIPPRILCCSKESMQAFMQGLFDTDGHVVDEKEMREVGLTNTSERLIKEVQSLLLKFGIVCSVKMLRERQENWNKVYELKITGQDLVLFSERIGFRLARKQVLLQSIIDKSDRNYPLTDQIYHVGPAIERVMKKFGGAMIASRDDSGHSVVDRVRERVQAGQGVSYDMLQRFLSSYDFVEQWGDEDYEGLLYVCEKHYYYDEVESLESGEDDTYDVYIPEGHTFWSNGLISHNSKILGIHASIIGIDEYARFPKEFIDTVVLPMANRKKNPNSRGNRLSIISTPLSKSNHYYTEFCRYQKEMIENPDGDYHVSTYTFLDSDGVDMNIIRDQIKSMPFERFARENLAMFTSNEGGFFSEELIRQCEDEISICLSGDPEAVYVMGIDPPSVNNQCGICIFKLVDDNKKVELAYICGIPASYITTPQLLSLTIRLCRRFNIKRIHVDQGGGGLQLAQILYTPQAVMDDYDSITGTVLPEKSPDGMLMWAGAKNPENEATMISKQLEDVVIQITSFSPVNKSAMYFNLRNGMQSGNVVLPPTRYDKLHIESNLLKGELENLKGGLSSSHLVSLTKPADAFDDRADAYALAFDAYMAMIRGNNIASRVGGGAYDRDYDNLRIGDWGGRRDISFPDRSDWTPRRD